jgi:acylphosphatase
VDSKREKSPLPSTIFVTRTPLCGEMEFMLANQATRRYLVSGRVQGVGYRWYVEREARALGICGWVRNRQDGSVEVFAAGTEAQLGALHLRLREGPRASRVDTVEVEEAFPQAGLSTFRIEGTW